VARLADGVQEAGVHSETFALGPGVPAGVYLLRLEAVSADGGRTVAYSGTQRLVKGR
jgi:hypothetical protein